MATGLSAAGFEKLETTVDGVLLNAQDEAVRAVSDAFNVSEDSLLRGDVLVNDSVPDLVRSVQLVNGPGHGTLDLRSDGTFLYTPGSFFNSLAAGARATETFSYRVTDADGDSDTARVTITVTGTNDAPTAVNDSASTNEDSAVTIAVRGNDSDVDGDALTLANLSGATSALGAAISIVNGQVLYDPRGSAQLQALNTGQSAVDSFSYTIRDPSGATATATVSITVSGVTDGFSGKTIDYTYVFPESTSVFHNQDIAVGAGVELSRLYPTTDSGHATLDISNDRILIDFYDANTWVNSNFNGFRIFDEFNAVSAFKGVSIVQNNMQGLSAANISFDANTISVNWRGLSFNESTLVELQVLF